MHVGGGRANTRIRESGGTLLYGQSIGFWSGRALATGTAWAGLCLIHHHHAPQPWAMPLIFFVKIFIYLLGRRALRRNCAP